MTPMHLPIPLRDWISVQQHRVPVHIERQIVILENPLFLLLGGKVVEQRVEVVAFFQVRENIWWLLLFAVGSTGGNCCANREAVDEWEYYPLIVRVIGMEAVGVDILLIL